MKKTIHFWVPYPLNVAPSQRFRVEIFLSDLEKAGFSFKVQTFLDQQAWNILYNPGKWILKTWGTIKGFFQKDRSPFSVNKG
jgi:hypothetical protein